MFRIVQKLLRFLLRCIYRFDAYGEEVLSAPGPVLLIPNHVTWLDWLFLAACLDTDWRFVTSAVTAQTTFIHRFIMVNRFTFPIDMSSPYAVKRMAEYLQAGGRLVLFAEGRITVTGSLMKIFEGTGFLLHKTGARVITCYLRGASQVPFVRHRSWTRWFPRVTVHFSALLDPPRLHDVSTTVARKRLTLWLRDQLLLQRFRTELDHGPQTALHAIVEVAKHRPGRRVMCDATRQSLSYRRLMTGVRLLAEYWIPNLNSASDRVGVLLPNINAAPVCILSLWAAGKVPAILNFSTGTAVMIQCARLAGLKQIITSQSFLERAKLDAKALAEAGLDLVLLENVRAQISSGKRVVAAVRQHLIPRSLPAAPGASDSGVILFTSGSEGMPKGVELTHRNLMANVHQMLTVIDLEDSDSLFNALPIFHSFGLTVGTLLPLVRGIFVFFYPSPLHYRIVPEAIYEWGSTIMLGTNTFLNGYARKAHPYDFRTVRYLFAGAEKVQEATALTWSRQFGIRILEGYGATECSPCLCVNTPFASRFGSAGRFLPDIEYKLAHVEGITEGGRLFVRGPNVMKGYLNPEANAAFQALGGWYDTGDLVHVDEEGFVHILGRMKRFAKISGEMVSLTAVEEALAGAFTQYGLRSEVVVISRPDPDKGEVLIAVTNEPRIQIDDLRRVVKSKGLTNLCVPRELRVVHEIPKLGTGKTNHRELQKMLEQDFTSEKQSAPSALKPN